MACKYCGQDAFSREDQYGQDECADCAGFFDANPNPFASSEDWEETEPGSGIYRRVQKQEEANG